MKLAKNKADISKYSEKLYFYIGIIFIPCIAFFPILGNSFSYWAADDDWMLLQNPSVYNFDWDTIIGYFTTFYHGQYSPLNTLAYSIIYQFWGMDPFAYHLVSLIFHILNSILVYHFVRDLLNQANHKILDARNYNSLIAFLTAVLFSIHPMQVESVAWISASKIVFSTTLFLCAMIMYQSYVNRGKKKLYWTSLILFLLSFGFKEQVVVLPVCLLLIDYMLNRNLFSAIVIKEKVPFFLVALILGIIEIIAQNSAFEAKLANEYYELYQRIILACYNISQYIVKLLIPFDLSYWYPFPMNPGEKLPVRFWVYPIFFLLIPIYFIIWIKDPKNKLIVFGSVFFLVNLFLMLHIIPMSRKVVMADRYVYVACIGYFLILSDFFVKWILQDKRCKLKIAVAIFYILYFCAYTFLYSKNWK